MIRQGLPPEIMDQIFSLLQEAFDKNLPVYPTREDGQAILEFIKKGLGKK